MEAYNPAKHSKERLGGVGMVPVVPVMPTACQVSVQTGMMHVRLLGESYVRASLPSLTPAMYKTVVKAIRACPTEPSYSGSTSPYYVLSVEPQADGQSAILRAAGGVIVGRIAVFAESEIVSVDESAQAQMDQAGGGDPDDQDDDGEPGSGSGPQGPGVN